MSCIVFLEGMDFSLDHPGAAIVATRSEIPPTASARSCSPWFRWALIFVLLLGTILRLGYIDHQTYNPDERVAEAVIRSLHFPSQWDTNWAMSDVTGGFHYNQYNFSSYHYLLYCWKSLISWVTTGWSDHLGALRALNGVLGLVFIWCLALAARQSIGEWAAIAAASAGAVTPLLVQDAHYARCESMLTAGVAILLWLMSRRVPTTWFPILGAGLVAGWMMASKATMGLAVPLLLPLIVSFTPSQKLWKSIWIRSGVAAVGVALGIVFGMPYGVAQPHHYLSGLSQLAMEYNTPMPPYTDPDMAPSYLSALAYMNGTLGWGFWTLTALGSVRLGKTWGWGLLTVLLLPLASTLIVFGGHALFTERSYSPFLPMAFLLFGTGAQFVAERIIPLGTSLRKYAPALLTLLLVSTLTLPAIYSWQLVTRIFSGREQAEKDAALVRMKSNLTGRKVRMFNVAYHAEDYRTIASALENNESVLVVLVDYYDPISPTCLTTLQQKFNGRILGVRESIFPGLPPCSLNTILSPRLWLLYIPAKQNG